jgi:glutathione S-transferase
LTVFSWIGSQWAGVAHLGLAEKGFGNEEVEIKEIDLRKFSHAQEKMEMLTQTNDKVNAENFDPEYLKKNPNGTVPTLAASHLSQPLVDTRQILEYLDQSRPSVKGPNLTPVDLQDQSRATALIELVHSNDLETGVIIFGCLNDSEFHRLQASPFMTYVAARQTALEKYHSADPTNLFYGTKLIENGALHSLLTGSPNADRTTFFADTSAKYTRFAAGLNMLERQILLPYAVGYHVTLADLHIAPWLSHTLYALGTTDPSDFSKLEGRIQQVVPNFKLGPKIPEWWKNFGKRDSFQKVFKVLH